MKSMMRGHERRRKRKVALAIVLIAVPVLAVGIWLLFFNGGSKLAVTYAPAESTPAASASAESSAPAPTPEESVLGVATAEASPASSIDVSDWHLLLVNAQHSLPDGYEVKLTELKNGQSVDERCYADLQKMMDDCRTAGAKPLICSSYRTLEKQQELFNNKVSSFKEQGCTDDEAHSKAAQIIAVPGTSEHQTGLAVDIVDIDNQNMDETQEDTPTQQWMMKNSWQYGFIFRFPADKCAVTGISYESWHYRYVGKDAAKAIHEQGLCLEEYVAQLS